MTHYRNHQHEIDTLLAPRRTLTAEDRRQLRAARHYGSREPGMGVQPLIALVSLVLSIGIMIGAAI